MTHFWGGPAIARRLGYRNVKSFYRAYAEGRVFAYKRRDPRDSRRTLWYSNETLILTAELALVQRHRGEWEARREEKRSARAGH